MTAIPPELYLWPPGSKPSDMKTTYEILQASSAGDDPLYLVEARNKLLCEVKGFVKGQAEPFWNTRDDGQQCKYDIACASTSIKGLDGMLGAKTGEIRRLHVPSEEGYGPGGNSKRGVPPNADLVLEIEIVEVRTKADGRGGVRKMMGQHHWEVD